LWALAEADPASATVVLVGGEEDRPATAAVRAASATGPYATVDLAGETDLLGLAGLLARADAVISNDSGVAHLAAALGRPVAVVFGSTDPRWTAPRGERVAVVSHPPPCAPCFLRTCAIADAYRCLYAVDPQEVAAGLSSGSTGAAASTGGSAPDAVRSTRARPRRRAVFLDRDGTLMPELGYLGDPSRVRLLPGVGAALRILDRAGYALVVVTNQSAIGRGIVTAQAVEHVHERLRELLRAEQVELSGLYVCPHRPDEECDCRKPNPGLLERALRELGLERRGSWMVGDGAKDVEAGRRAGVKPLLVLTGWGMTERGKALLAGHSDGDVEPDLLAAAERIAAAERAL
ncbi:MAG: HAD-IIIA family hydrolase, partial [Candidatus Eiseniibacteriota bacterium]